MILPVNNKPDSYGSIDLYVTFKDADDNWTPVVNFGSVINTDRVESAARISPDGRYIFLTGLYIHHDWGSGSYGYSDVIDYFTKPGHGRADIYWIDAKIIEDLRPENMKK